jgi:hypothetical protein
MTAATTESMENLLREFQLSQNSDHRWNITDKLDSHINTLPTLEQTAARQRMKAFILDEMKQSVDLVEVTLVSGQSGS